MFGFQNRFDILRATKSFTRTGPKKQKTKKKNQQQQQQQQQH